jgi:hypothetical protein
MKKYLLFILTVAFVASNGASYARESKKLIRNEEIENGRLKTECVFMDKDNDNIYDEVSVKMESWDAAKNEWQKPTIQNISISDYKVNNTKSLAEQIAISDRLADEHADIFVNMSSEWELKEVKNAPSYRIYLTNPKDENYSNIGCLEVFNEDKAVFVSGEYVPTIPEIDDLRFFASLFFPNEDNDYTARDMDIKINEVINGDNMSVNFGALAARIIAYIEIYDQKNELVKMEMVNSRTNFEVDLHELPNDVYSLRLKSIEGIFAVPDRNILIAK